MINAAYLPRIISIGMNNQNSISWKVRKEGYRWLYDSVVSGFLKQSDTTIDRMPIAIDTLPEGE